MDQEKRIEGKKKWNLGSLKKGEVDDIYGGEIKWGKGIEVCDFKLWFFYSCLYISGYEGSKYVSKQVIGKFLFVIFVLLVYRLQFLIVL